MDKNDIYEMLLEHLAKTKTSEAAAFLKKKKLVSIINDGICIHFKWHIFRRYCEVSVANEYSIKSAKFTYNEINAIAKFALYELKEKEETND